MARREAQDATTRDGDTATRRFLGTMGTQKGVKFTMKHVERWWKMMKHGDLTMKMKTWKYCNHEHLDLNRSPRNMVTWARGILPSEVVLTPSTVGLMVVINGSGYGSYKPTWHGRNHLAYIYIYLKIIQFFFEKLVIRNLWHSFIGNLWNSL